MSFETIIFDLDGTLLDTLGDLTDSANAVLSVGGYPTRTEAEIRKFVENGVRLLLKRALPAGTPDAEIERCHRQFRVHYEQNMCNKTHPYDGIIPLLRALKQQGYRLGVVSNKFDLAVKTLCQPYFGTLLSVAIGERTGVRKKPAPDSVWEAIRALGGSRASALYVGDSDVDIQTAKNAGLPCAAVTWGFRDRSLLEKEGADFIIDRPEELITFVLTGNPA